MKSIATMFAAFAAILMLAGCPTAPKDESSRNDLHTNAESAMNRMKSMDSSLDKLMRDAYGYVLFPNVAKGGAIVGGSYGRGEVYEQGNMVGFADITQATVGAQLGGQSFSELILFQNKQAMDTFKNGKLKFAANVSAVALKSGAADSAKYNDGVLVFVEPKAGLMVEAAVGGQAFRFEPR